MDYNENSENFADDILKIKSVERILSNHDIIIPYLASKVKDSSILYKNQPIEKQDRNWKIIYEIIKKYYPEYLDDFEKVIFGRKQLWFNMFIAKRDTFCAYSEWIFSLLKKYDEYILDFLHEERTPRVDGFLSELLLLVWIEHNIDKDRIWYSDVKNTENNRLLYDNSMLDLIVRKKIYCNRRLLSAMKYIKMNACIIKTFGR